MSAAAVAEERTHMTEKSVTLHHAKDGTYIFLLETPTTLNHSQTVDIHAFNLGRFDPVTARTAQNRLMFRFVGPGEPLTEEEVAEIRTQIHCHPL